MTMEKKYTTEHLRKCWDYFIDGHYGLDGNPEIFSDWLARMEAKVISSNPLVKKSGCFTKKPCTCKRALEAEGFIDCDNSCKQTVL